MGDTGGRSSGTPLEERSHALHVFAGRLAVRLGELGSTLTATMTAAERGETLAEITRAQDQLEALAAELVADDPQAATELRRRTQVTAGSARRLVKRADRLQRHPQVKEALAAGEIHTDQADVITSVVDKLPEEVQHLADEARQVMLELALDHDAETLKGMGNHLLHVVAPELADELLARQLEKEEQDARRTAYLKLQRDGHGSTFGKFKIPDLHAHLLDTLLAAIANPQRPRPIDRTNRDLPEVKGTALCELLERVKPEHLPRTGGTAVSVIVTMTLDTLEGGLKPAGLLGTSLQLSAGEARRLAGRHGVIPAVLDGTSHVLDLGRHSRLASHAQRLALALRQQGLCNVTDCEIPAAWCDANHRTDWALGGRTDLDDLELVCGHHHTRHHQGRHYPRRT